MHFFTLESAASIWFEIWGVIVDTGQKISIFLNFHFFRQFHKQKSIFRANFLKISIFSGNFTKNFDSLGKFPKILIFFRQFHKKSIFQGKFQKNFNFPGKNWLFTAISGQVILFLFKVTTFLYMTRYNILRPVHGPLRHSQPPAQDLGVATPKPPGLTPMIGVKHTIRISVATGFQAYIWKVF